MNGIGQLVEVDEPDAVGAAVASTGCPGTGESIWVTSYTNDVLVNLTQVVQNGSHTRTFTYDSLSRLLTSANPETGTITYTYNPDRIGRLGRRCEPVGLRGVLTHISIHGIARKVMQRIDPRHRRG